MFDSYEQYLVTLKVYEVTNELVTSSDQVVFSTFDTENSKTIEPSLVKNRVVKIGTLKNSTTPCITIRDSVKFRSWQL